MSKASIETEKTIGNVMTKKEWIEYYTLLLNSNIETKAGLKKKYDDYESRRQEWEIHRDYLSYENGQQALKEILEI